MKKILILSAASVLITSGQAMAANLAVITTPPTMLKFVVFGVAIGCLVVSFRVLNVLKGGLLSRSWQVFMFGFALLAAGQLASLLGDFEIVNMPSFVAPALWVAMSGLFLYGIFEAKKILD